MSTPFSIGSFEEFLSTVRNELPKGCIYFRGQSKLAERRISVEVIHRALQEAGNTDSLRP